MFIHLSASTVRLRNANAAFFMVLVLTNTACRCGAKLPE